MTRRKSYHEMHRREKTEINMNRNKKENKIKKKQMQSNQERTKEN